MPTETTLNSLKVHKVPNFETWEENYDQVNGIGTSDVVVMPPEELKKGVLPPQANNSGKFLTTDGNGNTSWTTVDALPPQAENSGKILTTNGAKASWANETDPVFGASPAAGITQNDINSWDAKVSDDHKWNDVSLIKGDATNNSTIYIPFLSSSTGTTANITSAVSSPGGSRIAKYDSTAYLHSTTPSANDNSTKVATTAYVDAAIPDTSGFITTETDPTVPSWAKASTKPSYNASEVGAVATSAVGANSGVAPLNASGKIDSTYLPSYVDDVIEGYYHNSKFYTTSAHTTEITGETGKIFVDLSTNKTYRYGGSSFTEISQGSVVSVSRDLTSGTKIGTLTINGTGTDLYAPTPETFTVTGGASTIVSDNLTANRALISNTNGKVAVSDVTSTELGYLDGVTSAIQTQIDGKQAKVTASGILKGDGSGGVTAAMAADVAASHTHGNITSGGDITATAPTIASGDQIVINDHSASKITNGPTFDGSTTTSYLSKKGTWETPSIPKQSTWYGTCSTTDSTAQKDVICSGYELTQGNIIGVLFTTANTAATPTLNINSTGTKTIYIGGNSAPNSTTNVLKWSANTTVYFIYDGSNYRYITSISAGTTAPSRGANTWYGTSSTSATTQAKVSTIDNFVLTQGAIVCITFSTANTYSSAKITLNINSTGTKDVYYNNAVTSSTNTLFWNAGETITFIYSGSYYYFVGKSTSLPSQSGNSGKYLTTNGSNLSWETVDALPSQTGNSGKYLTTNGTTASWGDSVSGSLIDTENVSEISIDSTPTASSNNLVTSGGVYTALSGYIPSSEKGANSGVATLNSNGKVVANQTTSRLIDVTSSITLTNAHNGTTLLCYNADITITLPDPSSWDAAYEVRIIRWGSYAVTIQAASGVSLNGISGGSQTIQERYKSVFLKVINRTNKNWLILGNIDNKITYGTTDLTAGTSSLATGVIYLVYE